MSKAVKMEDIAKELGISVVSVSKGLAGKEGVSDQMRDRIFETALRLGYKLDKDKKKASGNIGVIVADRFMDDNAFYQKLYRQIIIHCTGCGYSGMLEIISSSDEKELIIPKVVRDHIVDGVVFMGDVSKEYIERFRKTKLPYILVDFHVENIDADCIISDNIYGEMRLTELMIERGRKKIAFVGDVLATTSILDRYLGYTRALLMNRIMPKEEWLIIDRDEDGRYIELALPENMPDAFVCNCDEVAFNLVMKLKQMGYRVPEDISVAGYDDYTFSMLCDPKLTTYKVNTEEMAKKAVEQLVKRIKGRTVIYGQSVIGGELIKRDSI